MPAICAAGPGSGSSRPADSCPATILTDHLRFVAGLLRPEPSDESLVNKLGTILQRAHSRAHVTCFWHGDAGEAAPQIPDWFKSAIRPLPAGIETDFAIAGKGRVG
jgi:hypothetical protein